MTKLKEERSMAELRTAATDTAKKLFESRGEENIYPPARATYIPRMTKTSLMLYVSAYKPIQGDATDEEWKQFQKEISDEKRRRRNSSRRSLTASAVLIAFAPVQVKMSEANHILDKLPGASEEEKTAYYAQVVAVYAEAINLLKEIKKTNRSTLFESTAERTEGYIHGFLRALWIGEHITEDVYDSFKYLDYSLNHEE